MQPIRWTDGSLTLVAAAATAEDHWFALLRSGTLNLVRVTRARVDYEGAPERFQQIDFSRWKDWLEPTRLPIDKADLADATLKLSIFPSPLETDLTAIRNRSGAIEATARVRGGGLAVQGFLRLGWDSLENGGSFEGSYDRLSNPYFFSFFDEQPFRSLLAPFGTIQFEGSFVLGPEWKFKQGVRLITASEPVAEFDGEQLTELAFSGATVFPDALVRENRAIIEGLLPDPSILFRLEVRRRGNGPVMIEVSLNDKPLLAVDADSWQDGSSARLRPEKSGTTTNGTLSRNPSGGMSFLPESPTATELPRFELPGILAIGVESP